MRGWRGGCPLGVISREEGHSGLVGVEVESPQGPARVAKSTHKEGIAAWWVGWEMPGS